MINVAPAVSGGNESEMVSFAEKLRESEALHPVIAEKKIRSQMHCLGTYPNPP